MSAPLLNRSKFSSVNPDGEAQLEQAVLNTYDSVVGGTSDIDDDAEWLREQRNSHKSLHWLRRPSVVMIGLCLFLHAFAFSCAEGTRQMIQLKLACNYVLKNNGGNTCDPTETQVLVSGLQQAYAIAGGITTIFASGKIGPLSDQHGRKVFLALIVLFLVLGKAMRYIIMTSFPELHFELMVLSEMLANLCGGVVTMVTLASCYVSDIAEAHQRTYYLGINVASLFVGFSVGPLAGNMILAWALKAGLSSLHMKAAEQFNKALSSGDLASYSAIEPWEFLPIKVELGICIAIILFIILVLPESRTEGARRMSRSLSRSLLISSFNSEFPDSGSLSRMLEMFNFLRPLRLILYPKDVVTRLRHPVISSYRVAVTLLVVAECLMTTISIPMSEIYVLYGIFRFGWNTQDIGHLLAVACSSRAFALMVLSPIISRQVFQKFMGLRINTTRFDHVDFSMVMFSFVIEIAGMLAFSVAPTGGVFLAVSSLTSLSAMASPALNSSIVKFFPELKIGELFGAIALVKNVLQILVPVLILGIYKNSLTKWHLPQVVFWLVSSVFVVGLGAVWYVNHVLDRADEEVKHLTEPVESRRASVHHRNLSFSGN